MVRVFAPPGGTGRAVSRRRSDRSRARSVSIANRIDPAAFASRPATRSTAISRRPSWASKRRISPTSFSSITPPGSTSSSIPSRRFSAAGWTTRCKTAVDDYRRQIRQAVFDRMSVGYLVSDRFEADPGWPLAAQGASGQFIAGSSSATRRHCRVRTWCPRPPSPARARAHAGAFSRG